jgi:hypothetical protein
MRRGKALRKRELAEGNLGMRSEASFDLQKVF